MGSFSATPKPRRAIIARPSLAKRFWWVGAIAATMLTVGVTLALWMDRVGTNAVISTGNFKFSLGNLTWHSPTQGLSGDSTNLASLSLGDGDKVTIDQEIKPDFTGNNLQVGFTVSLPGDLSGKWHIIDGTGQQVVPASGEADLGDELQPAIVGSGQPVWHVVVTIEVPSGTTVVTDPLKGFTDPGPSVKLGPLTIMAEQVRW